MKKNLMLGADLRGADLRGADLRGQDLQGVDLSDADLREADLRGARLQGVNLEEVDIWTKRLDVALWIGQYHRDTFACDVTNVSQYIIVGNMHLDSPNITIPYGLTVVGDVDLSDGRISRLPDGFTVTGDLRISRRDIDVVRDAKWLSVGGDICLA